MLSDLCGHYINFTFVIVIMQNKNKNFNISHIVTADISILNQFCHLGEENEVGLECGCDLSELINLNQ